MPIMYNHIYECNDKAVYGKASVFLFFAMAYVLYGFVLYNLFTAVSRGLQLQSRWRIPTAAVKLTRVQVILSDFTLSEEEKMLKQKWQYFTRLTQKERDEEKKADAAVERGVIVKDVHGYSGSSTDADAGGDTSP